MVIFLYNLDIFVWIQHLRGPSLNQLISELSYSEPFYKEFSDLFQISNLEHELLTGNTQWMTDTQEMETKLTQALGDLEHRNAQIQQLTEAVR